MGYDMSIRKLKRGVYDEYKRKNPTFSFKEIYEDALLCYFYPEDFRIEKEDEGKIIVSESTNIFKEYFKEEIGNDAVILIEKEEYQRMLDWLAEKLKGITLYEIAKDRKKDLYDYETLIRVYRDMKKECITDEEIAIFTQDW